MIGPVIILSRAGAQYAVRAVPLGAVDHDRALASYSTARAYAETLQENLAGARLDDRCRDGGAE